jgi:hypothetical protein
MGWSCPIPGCRGPRREWPPLRCIAGPTHAGAPLALPGSWWLELQPLSRRSPRGSPQRSPNRYRSDLSGGEGDEKPEDGAEWRQHARRNGLKCAPALVNRDHSPGKELEPRAPRRLADLGDLGFPEGIYDAVTFTACCPSRADVEAGWRGVPTCQFHCCKEGSARKADERRDAPSRTRW